VEWCPTDAIALNDEGLAQRDENACLGCGVCSRFCPEEAISLQARIAACIYSAAAPAQRLRRCS
jgi:Fe-S-cluster-containing hydrogenase component 2